MKTKYLLLASPLILCLEIYVISIITELLRQQSDIAVMAGVVVSCLFIALNYFLINFIIKQLNQKKPTK